MFKESGVFEGYSCLVCEAFEVVEEVCGDCFLFKDGGAVECADDGADAAFEGEYDVAFGAPVLVVFVGFVGVDCVGADDFYEGVGEEEVFFFVDFFEEGGGFAGEGDCSVFKGVFVDFAELGGFFVVGDGEKVEGVSFLVVEVEGGYGDFGAGAGEGDFGDDVDDVLGGLAEVEGGADGAEGALEAFEVSGFSFEGGVFFLEFGDLVFDLVAGVGVFEGDCCLGGEAFEVVEEVLGDGVFGVGGGDVDGTDDGVGFGAFEGEN